jgi:L-lactate permease
VFQQLLTRVAGSLALSFVTASLPILTALVMLGVLRRPAWQASLAGLIVGLVIAVGVWSLPVGLAVGAALNGIVFALWPAMWTVFNAMLLYDVAATSGRFDAFRRWPINHLPNDRRIVLVAIGFRFGALLEGVAGIVTALALGLGSEGFVTSVKRMAQQIWLAALTVCFIVGLAFLMNYSGLADTLGKSVASAGALFVLLSAFLGWIAAFLSDSDTSGNALFGNLQVVASKQLGFNPALFAAANWSGGVMGKTISPRNIATGVSATDLKGREGEVFARAFPHSMTPTVIFGLLVALRQFVIPWIIPAVPGAMNEPGALASLRAAPIFS